jgi:lysophospholipase L1-like esterase
MPSSNGQPVTVAYGLPIVVGGATPVAMACAPVNGSKFPVGVNTVACTATDSQQRSDTCTFTVTIQPPAATTPLLSLTRFTSFGDSITEGKVSAGSLKPYATDPCVEPSSYRATAYPTLLQGKLTQRYPAQAQAIAVRNHGCGGEKAADAWASGRFVSVLTADSPQVLLLFEGANDLRGTDTNTITTAVDALRSMVQEAKRRRITVFLATLLPQRTVSCGCPDQYRATGPALVQPANDQIRALASREGAIVVDLYQALGGVPGPYIDTDGLHPTLQGHELIASTFFGSITSRLELSGTTATVLLGR